MTVAELIELLQECDPDKRVVIWYRGTWINLYQEDVEETEHDEGYEGVVKILT